MAVFGQRRPKRGAAPRKDAEVAWVDRRQLEPGLVSDGDCEGDRVGIDDDQRPLAERLATLGERERAATGVLCKEAVAIDKERAGGSKTSSTMSGSPQTQAVNGSEASRATARASLARSASRSIGPVAFAANQR